MAIISLERAYTRFCRPTNVEDDRFDVIARSHSELMMMDVAGGTWHAYISRHLVTSAPGPSTVSRWSAFFLACPLHVVLPQPMRARIPGHSRTGVLTPAGTFFSLAVEPADRPMKAYHGPLAIMAISDHHRQPNACWSSAELRDRLHSPAASAGI